MEDTFLLPSSPYEMGKKKREGPYAFGLLCAIKSNSKQNGRITGSANVREFSSCIVVEEWPTLGVFMFVPENVCWVFFLLLIFVCGDDCCFFMCVLWDFELLLVGFVYLSDGGESFFN